MTYSNAIVCKNVHTNYFCRVLKQALRSSGGNATEKHIEEVSLCNLFLMEAAKKADQEFGVAPTSSRHTVRDASADIRKMAVHLLEYHVTTQKPGRNSPPFNDSTNDGFKKMSLTWLKHILTQAEGNEDDTEQQSTQKEVDLDYEIFNVV